MYCQGRLPVLRSRGAFSCPPRLRVHSALLCPSVVSCRVSLALADPHYYRTAGTEQSWGMESQEDRKKHRVEFALPCIALSLWLFSEEIIVYPLCSGSRKSTQSAKHAGVRCDAMEGKGPIRNDRGGSLEEFGATTPKGMRMVDMAQAC